MKRRPRTLIVARDPGAASALVPVIRAGPAEVIGLADARRFFEREGVQCDEVADTTARAALEGRRPETILTGTSREPRRDAEWWDAARSLGIPSVGLVDHCWNLHQRFTDKAPFDSRPDQIAVIDEASRLELQAQRCPVPIEVTGHPAFDALLAAPPRGREAARALWGAGREDRVVLFASEPIAADIGPAASIDETAALRMLLDGLGEWRIVIRPHPRDDPAALRGISNGRAVVDDATPRHAAVAGADAVVGITSIFLLEAALAGRPVLSLDRNARGLAQRFPLLIAAAADPGDVRRWLRDEGGRAIPASERLERSGRSGFFPGSVMRVWSLLETVSS
jgi:hypothetical protein